MWKVVHFFNDNSVEPVPDYWLNKENNVCAWPNNNHLAKKICKYLYFIIYKIVNQLIIVNLKFKCHLFP